MLWMEGTTVMSDGIILEIAADGVSVIIRAAERGGRDQFLSETYLSTWRKYLDRKFSTKV